MEPVETREQPGHFKASFIDYVWFLIPSLLGVFLFISPIWQSKVGEDGEVTREITLPVAWIANWASGELTDFLPKLTLGILLVSAVGSLIVKLAKPKRILDHPFWSSLFNVSWFWVGARTLGCLFGLMVFYEYGTVTLFQTDTEYVVDGGTGNFAFGELATFLVVIFFFAGLFLPLLLDFGLLEFIGTLMSKIMRPLFKLPGRSAIDCVASWVGDGTVGILLTSKQYEAGFYTSREAAVVGTTFSFVSITFTIVVLSTVGITDLFLQAYLTLVVAGLAAAVICPRIPPLSWKPDTFFEGKPKRAEHKMPHGMGLFAWGVRRATHRANQVEGVMPAAKLGVQNVMDMWVGVVPVVVAMATVAAIVANFTPFFQWMGAPVVPVLKAMGIPEAEEAGYMFLIGFADMLLPAIFAADKIESEFTRFIIATVSCTQLIYMSEVGSLLMGSKVPVKFWELVVIFVIRTMITLPIVVGMAYGMQWLGWM
ncbi:Nucleoside recognition [Poriferisphaera corsica]|uniref:Nucleoside recognition n=1 Tax=Poriferisphaera corsica TaxID=2528020 RepID=A0A517YQ89_9BACT|nr:YjiH family protein [Poriferisphaera corsica]QDU32394.1 Nucleoside recognition [Poriferisphaera corsica]